MGKIYLCTLALHDSVQNALHVSRRFLVGVGLISAVTESVIMV